MHFGEESTLYSNSSGSNPLKRTFVDMESSSSHQDYNDDDVLTTNHELNPRSYQKKIFRVAARQNTIAVLDTGSGKTVVALMLINWMGRAVSPASSEKQLIIFLAPTKYLVNQQYEYIKMNTELRVGQFSGDIKGIDEWESTQWEEIIKDFNVIVMTPQILLDGLRKGFLRLESVCLLILDECHHATGNNPYVKIMKEFYHKTSKKPKVFGMTASPVIKKGFSSIWDCEDQLSELESVLDSQIYTVEDRTEVEIFVPSAKVVTKFYDPAPCSYSELKAKLEASWSKFNGELLEQQVSVPSQYKDMGDKLKTLQKRLSNDHAKIVHCLDTLGLLCAYEAVVVCIENASGVQDGCEFYRNCSVQYKNFLEEASSIFHEALPNGGCDLQVMGFDYGKAVYVGYISPKLHELLELFQLFGGNTQVSCLIFVERIITAIVIMRFIKRLPCLSQFTVSFLAGSNSSVDALAPKIQKETLKSFHAGQVNLLITTDVVEEGIDVHNCSCVIRFDLPKTVRSYVQSRGRARQKDSQYIMMLERGNTKHIDQIFDIIRSEHSMADTAVNRDPNICLVKACSIMENDSYVVDATGATLTIDSSVNLIYLYCTKLPGDKYFTPKPIFQISLSDGSYNCQLTLPPNAAFQILVGPSSQNSHLAKQLVCLEACKKLHQLGALDDRLLPAIEERLENDLSMRNKDSASGVGTTKRKELHGTTCVHSLSGTWGDGNDGAKFHAYKMVFSCNVVGEIYSNFVLLLESKLDDDVGNIEVELYLLRKVVKSSISSCGEIYLDAEKVMKAKQFQELFFNGLFGKLYLGSRSSGTERTFLLNAKNVQLWHSSDMYLILPLEPSAHPWKINWTAIKSSSYAVEFLKKNLGGKTVKSLPWKTYTEETKCKSLSVIHMANDTVSIENLKGKAVVAVHTGRVYTVLDVVKDSSADSPFDGQRNKTFREYFNKKYGIPLLYPEQQLLKLKQSHNPHNLLVDFNAEDASSHGRTPRAGPKMAAEKSRNFVHIPPELLVVVVGVSSDILKSLYLLPSIMYRLKSLMLASQLREEIACHFSGSHVPCSLILEALTTLRCSEKFSMERLELLGDSVLKYAVSCHLFFKYPEKHEGQLSTLRKWSICNANLHNMGISHNLQEYIRDSAFEPVRWTAPGQHSIHPAECSCGVDTAKVPLDGKFHCEDEEIVVGKACDKGHRWMCSKTISDCVEALIGAYYTAGGLEAAISLMQWLGIAVELEPLSVQKAIESASLYSHAPMEKEIESLETKLGYTFTVKGLLLEAITHASKQTLGLSYCYQRLEFLGDSVLDLLITWHLYRTHTNIDPGQLTDLRSASVNNENFAQVAVRRDLQQHLQHCSGLLLNQISDYTKSLSYDEDAKSVQLIKGPKALGDMIESIVGAIFIDTGLKMDEVWRIFEPLLSPIVTPDSLELPPFRELFELCSSMGYFINRCFENHGDTVQAELQVQLKDDLLIGHGCARNKKDAKGRAAFHLLKDLKSRGISYSRSDFKRRKDDTEEQAVIPSPTTFGSNSNQTDGGQICKPILHKKQKTVDAQLPKEPSEVSSTSGDASATPVIESIDMHKGGPRRTLYALCQKQQWLMPSFKSSEQKSRSQMVFLDGPEKRTGFNSYESKITLDIPNYGTIECTGDPKADKKSSTDSAALHLLYRLKELGKVIIGDS